MWLEGEKKTFYIDTAFLRKASNKAQVNNYGWRYASCLIYEYDDNQNGLEQQSGLE